MLWQALLIVFDVLFFVCLAAALLMSILFLAFKYGKMLRRRQEQEKKEAQSQDKSNLDHLDCESDPWMDLSPPPTAVGPARPVRAWQNPENVVPLNSRQSDSKQAPALQSLGLIRKL